MQTTVKIRGIDGLEQIALGQRTVVYRGRSRSTHGPVAVKVLLPHLAADDRFVARFRRDMQAAARVRHVNLVNTLEYGRSEEGAYYLVVEYCEGTPLGEALAAHPSVVPVPVALTIVLSLARGLEALHAERLVHRDLRPTNVVIVDGGVVKLANASLATDLGENGCVTYAGRVTATPAYMSPEQAAGREELTGQSDIFALGSLAWELLAGKRAFGKGDPGEIIARIQSQDVAPIASVNPLVEPKVERVIAGMLQKDFMARYTHVSELVMDLEEAVKKHEILIDPAQVAAWSTDPEGYTRAYNREQLARLTATPPPSEEGKPSHAEALLRYYRQRVFLDPADKDARKELDRLSLRVEEPSRGASADGDAEELAGARYAELDPNAEYRVVLESFDTERENDASFALKLSMKLRSPLPHIRGIVRNRPSRLTGKLPYAQAVNVANAVEKLGGRVRMEVCAPDRSASDAGRGGQPRVRRKVPGGRTCPECGWVEDPDAMFCSVCLHRFEGERAINLRDLGNRQIESGDNPLAVGPPRPSGAAGTAGGLVGLVRRLPPSVTIGAGILLLVVLLSLVLRR